MEFIVYGIFYFIAKQIKRNCLYMNVQMNNGKCKETNR